MSARAADRRPDGHPSMRSPFGWTAVLTGPLAWATQLFANWMTGEVLACGQASRPRAEVYGLSVNAVATLITAALLLATVLAGVGAYLELRRVRASDVTTAGRATWVARAGVMSCAFFTVVIATSFVPVGLIEGCG